MYLDERSTKLTVQTSQLFYIFEIVFHKRFLRKARLGKSENWKDAVQK